MFQTIWRPSGQFSDTRSALLWWKNVHATDLPARGFVWIVHGLGEHAARYTELAAFLCQLGFDVLAPDLPGHGLSAQSGGQKKLVPVDAMVAELRDTFSFWNTSGPLAKKGAGHADWQLLGHSLGALLALSWILDGKKNSKDPFAFAKRAYISAPPLKLRLPIPSWKLQASQLLLKVAPDFKLSNEIDVNGLSYDSANIAAYRNDPLVHGGVTSRLFDSINLAAARVLRAQSDVEIPICLTVGADDPVVDPTALKNYFSGLKTHKKFLEFSNMKHETLNEVGREYVYKSVAEWFL